MRRHGAILFIFFAALACGLIINQGPDNTAVISVSPSSVPALEIFSGCGTTVTVTHSADSPASTTGLLSITEVDPGNEVGTFADNCTGLSLSPGQNCTFGIGGSAVDGAGSTNAIFTVEAGKRPQVAVTFNDPGVCPL